MASRDEPVTGADSSIDGLRNFRDLGGLPVAGDGSTRFGVLFRSDGLADLTDEGLAQLARTGIAVVVDLRTPLEQEMAPDRLPDRGLRVIGLPLVEGSITGLVQAASAGWHRDEPGVESEGSVPVLPTLAELYVSLLADGAEVFAAVARLVAEADAGVLVHCSGGKDRTGLVVAVLLGAVGVEREAIVADYTSSGANLAGPWADGMLAMIGQLGVPLTPELVELVAGSPSVAIDAALTWLDREHGDCAGYLRSGGLSDDVLESMRRALTV